ncbi:hypothetical protein CTAYLR_001264 [Chrysophaeum taylorii]|uniref:RGS domain-containing protein n=1 Tax=Chrysophaeum taylorii TaxID=2483200 RepID=A0AAD7UEM4_9STRA|nr:hypothetical protein CTAYLR_001264 [Chrysophaeum taylorii]
MAREVELSFAETAARARERRESAKTCQKSIARAGVAYQLCEDDKQRRRWRCVWLELLFLDGEAYVYGWGPSWSSGGASVFVGKMGREAIATKKTGEASLPRSWSKLPEIGTYRFDVETAGTGLLSLAVRTRHERGLWINALRLATRGFSVKHETLPAGYAPLGCVLASDFARSEIRRFLRDEIATEGLEFWEAVESHRKLVAAGSGARRADAVRIYREFVAEDAPHQVNISAALRKTTADRLLDDVAPASRRDHHDDDEIFPRGPSSSSSSSSYRKLAYLLGESEAHVALSDDWVTNKIERLLGGREAALALKSGLRLTCSRRARHFRGRRGRRGAVVLSGSSAAWCCCEAAAVRRGATCFDSAQREIMSALEYDVLVRFLATPRGDLASRVVRCEHGDGALKRGDLRLVASWCTTHVVSVVLGPRSLVWYASPAPRNPIFVSGFANNASTRDDDFVFEPPTHELLFERLVAVVDGEEAPKSTTFGVKFASEIDRRRVFILNVADDPEKPRIDARLVFSAPDVRERDAWADLLRRASQAAREAGADHHIVERCTDWRQQLSPPLRDDTTVVPAPENEDHPSSSSEVGYLKGSGVSECFNSEWATMGATRVACVLLLCDVANGLLTSVKAPLRVSRPTPCDDDRRLGAFRRGGLVGRAAASEGDAHGVAVASGGGGNDLFATYLKVADVLTNLFPIWTLVFSAWGLMRPQDYAWLTTEYFTAGLAVLMLSMGITLAPSDFVRVLSRPNAVLVNLLLCYGMMPMLGLTLGNAFGLDPALVAGMVLVGSINGGQASNLCTFIANGNVALSVLMTTATTIGAIFATPFLCKQLLGAVVPVDAMGIVFSTLQVVLAPIVIGMVLNIGFPKVVNAVKPATPVIGVASTCLLVAAAVGQVAGPIKEAGMALQMPVLLLHLVGGIAGYWISRILGFGETTSRTMAIETSMKSSAFGFLLAKLHFGAEAASNRASFYHFFLLFFEEPMRCPQARVPSAVSVVWMALTGSSLAVAWRFLPVTPPKFDRSVKSRFEKVDVVGAFKRAFGGGDGGGGATMPKEA